MQPKSDNLFHFTKSLQILKTILKNGIEPRYCLEDIEWIGTSHTQVAYAMKCFCDIPLTRISEHKEFYGHYGIGLTKEWGLKNGLQPVIYLREDGSIKKCIRFLLGIDEPSDEVDKEELRMTIVSMLALCKPLKGKMLVDGKYIEKEFFQENEWRYSPPIREMLLKHRFTDDVALANAVAAKEHTLAIKPQDIKYIFVNEDSEIPEMVDFINSNLSEHSLNDLKILQSRIISLKSIEADL